MENASRYVHLHTNYNEAMHELTIRRATKSDVHDIVALLTDDILGATREQSTSAEMAPYLTAFAAIQADHNQALVVAELANQVVGTMQLTVIPGLSRKGAKRGLIEAVRVSSALRSQGIGERMMHWALDYFREHDCRMAQLTTDQQREGAHRFYARLGFVNSHYGFKLEL